MNPDQLDLARRLAAHPRFEWRRGMLAIEGTQPGDDRWRIIDDGPDLSAVTSEHVIHEAPYMPSAFARAYPDLTDAATGGVLWVMAGKPLIVGVGESGFISLQGPEMPEHGGATLMFGGDTLAEACARALLAEWGDS